MPTISSALALERFTTFGDLLKYLRRRAGLTQRELSIAVSYSDTQISRLEQNERLPDLAALAARFLPALHLEDQADVAKRLLELAAAMRREDSPALGLPPYKGLRCFEESDAELYFGREALTSALAARLEKLAISDRRFLAIIGASGSGKSSLVRAGLIPALRWRHASAGWPVILISPTAHPLEALADGLVVKAAWTSRKGKSAPTWSGIRPHCRAACSRVMHRAEAVQAVLIVDQFEELFTLCWSEREQSRLWPNSSGRHSCRTLPHWSSSSCAPISTPIVGASMHSGRRWPSTRNTSAQ
jgi:transcriptional regulator with XRE-family HTH domain